MGVMHMIDEEVLYIQFTYLFLYHYEVGILWLLSMCINAAVYWRFRSGGEFWRGGVQGGVSVTSSVRRSPTVCLSVLFTLCVFACLSVSFTVCLSVWEYASLYWFESSAWHLTWRVTFKACINWCVNVLVRTQVMTKYNICSNVVLLGCYTVYETF